MVGHYGTLLPVANMVRGGACRPAGMWQRYTLHLISVVTKSDGFKSATISVVACISQKCRFQKRYT